MRELPPRPPWVVTRRAARGETRARPGRADPEDARHSERGSVTSPRSRRCCHNETARAALPPGPGLVGPATPRRPVASALPGSRSPARTPPAAAAATATAASAAAAPPRAPRGSRPGRGPGRAAIGQVLTNQRRRRRELRGMPRTDTLPDQSLTEGARLREGGSGPPSGPHRVRGREAGRGGVRELETAENGQGAGPIAWGHRRSYVERRLLSSESSRDRSKHWSLQKTGSAFAQ